MLGEMFNGQNIPDMDKDGCYFIDRNGKYFDHILDFMRDSSYRPPNDIMMAVIQDATYFKLWEYAGWMQLLYDSTHHYE